LHQLLKSLNHSKNHVSNEDSRILIFVLYKKEAERVLETLRYIGFTAAAIHGDMGQAARMASLEQFKTGKIGLLVATDVAARGLDIPNVSAVINYSFPLTIEGMCLDYIRVCVILIATTRLHTPYRAYRTGRQGREELHLFHRRQARACIGWRVRTRFTGGGFRCRSFEEVPYDREEERTQLVWRVLS